MKIALLGYGRMGKEVERQAYARGHEISAIFDINDSFSPESDVRGAQAVISFVLAEGVLYHIKVAAQLGLPIVEGTTGWYDQLDQLKSIKNLTIIYSPNFSIGVYQFTKLTRYAAQLMGSLPEYDCFLHEFHHVGKADSPSGTAKKLAHVLLENLPHKDKVLYDTSHGVINPATLHVTSTRVGRVPGTHEIGFDSPADEIVLRHVAHGREGFASGAIRAAEWLVGKTGIYTMDDFMHDFN
ncbi:4-hydroxy-tetrahydrodipicolinate reductase [candidate division KSB1 bacterium]|nr:4-hydroxy-tetrahydrodipicolinate reductase [candidate division KSB1 bacterium]RQW01800.1 MAG: 4-hydroxy-tetrahydrodipicolinate reductase [candidate division KSB1 bacterium]